MKPIPGGVLLAARQRTRERQSASLVSRSETFGNQRGVATERSLLWLGWSRGNSDALVTKVWLRPRRGDGHTADFLAMRRLRSRHSHQALRLRQPEYSFR
jgi:hypothetical protein